MTDGLNLSLCTEKYRQEKRKSGCESSRKTTAKKFPIWGQMMTTQQILDDPRCKAKSMTALRARLRKYPPEVAAETDSFSGDGKTTKPIFAFGEFKPLRQHVQNPLCVVNYETARTRIFKIGHDPETAMTTLPGDLPKADPVGYVQPANYVANEKVTRMPWR